MKLTTTEVSIHREGESPLFGELTTKVNLGDEGAGLFICISQDTDDGVSIIRMDFNEVEYLIKAIIMLKAGVGE